MVMQTMRQAIGKVQQRYTHDRGRERHREHLVRVVPATLVRLLGVGERGVKNDQRDAQQLSKASWQTDVPSVHIPSQPAQELRSICGARDVLVRTRTKLINNVRGWMRTQL
jgi:transposase